MVKYIVFNEESEFRVTNMEIGFQGTQFKENDLGNVYVLIRYVIYFWTVFGKLFVGLGEVWENFLGGFQEGFGKFRGGFGAQNNKKRSKHSE